MQPVSYGKGMLGCHAQHGWADMAAMYRFDHGHIEVTEAILALDTRTERDFDLVVGQDAQSHAGAKTQVFIVGAQDDLGMAIMFVDRLCKHRVFSVKPMAIRPRQQ